MEMEVVCKFGPPLQKACYELEGSSFISPFVYDLIKTWETCTIKTEQVDSLSLEKTRKLKWIENKHREEVLSARENPSCYLKAFSDEKERDRLSKNLTLLQKQVTKLLRKRM